MKTVLYALGGLLLLIVALVLFLFSPIGNGIIQSQVESTLEEEAPDLKAYFDVFDIGFSSLHCDLRTTGDSRIIVQGGYSLLSQSVDLTYAVQIKDLAAFAELAKRPISGSLQAEGTVKGDQTNLAITGQSDVASSEARFSGIVLDGGERFEQVELSIQHAKLAELLAMAGEPVYADAMVNLDAEFPKLDPEAPSGDAKLTITQGNIRPKVFAKHLSVNLPESRFDVQLDAKAAMPKVDYDLRFNSTLAILRSSGSAQMEQQQIDASYSADITELELFKPLTQMDLRGPVKTEGTVSGSWAGDLMVDGSSDLAESHTRYQTTIRQGQPQALALDIQKLKLDQLLYLMGQPKYARADVDLSVDLSDINLETLALHGPVTLQIREGQTNAGLVSQISGMKTPAIQFTGDSNLTLTGQDLTGETHLNTSLADFSLLETKANLSTQNLFSRYRLSVSDLDKLYFATGQHLAGALVATGHVDKKESLEATIQSSFLDGTIDGRYTDSAAPYGDGSIALALASLQTTAVSDLLIQPQFFSAGLDGTLQYDLATRQGTLDSTLKDGKILPNDFTTTLQSLTGFDITEEVYVKSTLDSVIDKDIILSNLDMNSSLTTIYAKNAKIDLAQESVDARIDLGLEDSLIGVKLSGKMDDPDVGIDAKDFIQKNAVKKAPEIIEKLKSGDGKKLDSMLKGLFGQ